MSWPSAEAGRNILLGLVLIVGGANIASNHSIAASVSSVQRQSQQAQATAQRREQAAQARQARMVEQKLCTTLGKLAALDPPAGNPSSNPSRAYEDNLHATLAQLGPDLGCAG